MNNNYQILEFIVNSNLISQVKVYFVSLNFKNKLFIFFIKG